MKKKNILILILVVIVLGGCIYIGYNKVYNAFNETPEKETKTNGETSTNEENSNSFVEVIKENNSGNDANLKNGGKDDYGSDTYYFVGDSDNNYVSFADFTWRIVRINGDGTVRLVLSDYIRDEKGNIIKSGYVKDSTTGKTFEEAKKAISYKKSLVKEKVNKWVKENFSDDELNKVAKSKFCHDYSGKKDGKIFKFGAYLRISNKDNNVYACSDSSGIFESKFALLSYDETRDKEYENGYLKFLSEIFEEQMKKDKSTRVWLLSPYDMPSSFEYNTSSNSENGGLSMCSFGYEKKKGQKRSEKIGVKNSRMDRENVIQPVMSLVENVMVSGSGTKGDPYIVK